MKPSHFWEGKRAKHRSAQLTEHDVYLIKGLLKEGLSPVEIAGKFEVSKHVIYRIRNGQTWLHVPEYQDEN
jgi:predicted DNA-binding protein YlxM (UPF0122 family)